MQLHFFILAVISWVISLFLITSHTMHNSSTYRNCNWMTQGWLVWPADVCYTWRKAQVILAETLPLSCPVHLKMIGGVSGMIAAKYRILLFLYLWGFGEFVFCRDTLCGRKSINKVCRKHFMNWNAAVKGKAMHLKCDPASPPLWLRGCPQHHHWLKSLSLPVKILIWICECQYFVSVFCWWGLEEAPRCPFLQQLLRSRESAAGSAWPAPQSGTQ